MKSGARRQRPRTAGVRSPHAAYHRGIAEILTQRLLLRPFCVADLPAFVAYRRDPDVARYQGWGVDYSMADAERFLAEQERAELGQVGAWVQLAAVNRANEALMGDCASHVVTEPPATAEIGVTLAPASQGRGLAREALMGLVSALFEHHHMHRVIAHADDRNRPVQGLLERLGFRCEARLVEADWFKAEWTTLRVYAMLDREWRPLGGSPAAVLSNRVPEPPDK
jgi:RimJ/RimL family protein N-acetyltransferase